MWQTLHDVLGSLFAITWWVRSLVVAAFLMGALAGMASMEDVDPDAETAPAHQVAVDDPSIPAPS